MEQYWSSSFFCEVMLGAADEVHTSLNKERELYFPKNGSEKLAENEFNYVALHLPTLSDKYHFHFQQTTQV